MRNVEEIVRSILLSGNGFVDTRKVWGILSLDKTYPLKKIDEACKFAMECDQLSYQTVLSFLRLLPEKKSDIPSSKNNKFTRNPNGVLWAIKIN